MIFPINPHENQHVDHRSTAAQGPQASVAPLPVAHQSVADVVVNAVASCHFVLAVAGYIIAMQTWDLMGFYC